MGTTAPRTRCRRPAPASSGSRRKARYGAQAFASIEDLIRDNLSSEQIVGRLRLEGTEVMSHETIYRCIWKDKLAGGGLWLYLRGARKQRRKRYDRHDSRGRLAGKKMIGRRRHASASVIGKSTPCMAKAPPAC